MLLVCYRDFKYSNSKEQDCSYEPRNLSCRAHMTLRQNIISHIQEFKNICPFFCICLPSWILFYLVTYFFFRDYLLSTFIAHLHHLSLHFLNLQTAANQKHFDYKNNSSIKKYSFSCRMYSLWIYPAIIIELPNHIIRENKEE